VNCDVARLVSQEYTQVEILRRIHRAVSTSFLPIVRAGFAGEVENVGGLMARAGE
jgi:hypothetical protein